MRLKGTEELVGHLLGRCIDHAPADLAEPAGDRGLHRVAQPGVRTTGPVFVGELNLRLAARHARGAARAFKAHRTALGLDHVGQDNAAGKTRAHRTDLDHHAGRLFERTHRFDGLAAGNAGRQDHGVVQGSPDPRTGRGNDDIARQFHANLPAARAAVAGVTWGLGVFTGAFVYQEVNNGRQN